MMDYIISADNMGDLPESYIQEKQISLMSLSYMIDGETYNQENSLPSGEFYDKMRRGSMPTTSQVNPEEARKILENMLEAGGRSQQEIEGRYGRKGEMH